MPEDKNGIGIIFQVAGGGSISGESGKVIKKQLDDIAKQYSQDGNQRGIEVSLSKDAATKLKKQLDEIFDKYKGMLSNLGNAGSGKGRGSGGGSGSGSGGQSDKFLKARNAHYERYVSILRQQYSLEKKLSAEEAKAGKKSDNYKTLKSQLDEAIAARKEYESLISLNHATLFFGLLKEI